MPMRLPFSAPSMADRGLPKLLAAARARLDRDDEAVLATVAEAARAAGAVRLVGEYLPSPKNAMVAGHFEALGFAPAGAAGADGTRWALELADYTLPELPMDRRSDPLTEAA